MPDPSMAMASGAGLRIDGSHTPRLVLLYCSVSIDWKAAYVRFPAGDLAACRAVVAACVAEDTAAGREKGGWVKG